MSRHGRRARGETTEPANERATDAVDAELSSFSSALEEVAGRVATMAESLVGTDDDALASDLFEVERSLREAVRRIAHARGRASRRGRD
jgi:hypothetical protein